MYSISRLPFAILRMGKGFWEQRNEKSIVFINAKKRFSEYGRLWGFNQGTDRQRPEVGGGHSRETRQPGKVQRGGSGSFSFSLDTLHRLLYLTCAART